MAWCARVGCRHGWPVCGLRSIPARREQPGWREWRGCDHLHWQRRQPPALDKAHRPQEKDGDSWHCNRHTFASRLITAGVDIRTVAALMGHSTIQMTMRYEAVDKLGAESPVDW